MVIIEREEGYFLILVRKMFYPALSCTPSKPIAVDVQDLGSEHRLNSIIGKLRNSLGTHLSL